jgi:hypothetical protein
MPPPFTGQEDLTGVGLVHAREHLDHGRLAGAILAEERHDLTLTHVEGCLLHRAGGVERLAQAPDAEQGKFVWPRRFGLRHVPISFDKPFSFTGR